MKTQQGNEIKKTRSEGQKRRRRDRRKYKEAYQQHQMKRAKHKRARKKLVLENSI